MQQAMRGRIAACQVWGSVRSWGMILRVLFSFFVMSTVFASAGVDEGLLARQELVAKEIFTQLERVAEALEEANDEASARLAASKITSIARGPVATAVRHGMTLGALGEANALALAEKFAEKGEAVHGRMEKAFFALLDHPPEVAALILPAWGELIDTISRLPGFVDETEEGPAAGDPPPPRRPEVIEAE